MGDKRYRPMILPWSGEWTPHAILDLGRDCNIRCRACYNASRGAGFKPLRQVERELDFLMSKRRLHMVSVTGGEPTLHPDLPEIIRLIGARGMAPVLISNGLLLDEILLDRLADAGLSLLLIHVDEGQSRPDLAKDAGFDQLWELRTKIAMPARSRGITVGGAVTLYASKLGKLPMMIERLFASECLDFLLFTNCTDFSPFGRVEGSLEKGLKVTASGVANPELAGETVDNGRVRRLLAEEMDMEPYAVVASSHDSGEARWLSYQVGVCEGGGDAPRRLDMRAAPHDRLLLALLRRVMGKNLFFVRGTPRRFRLQVLLNMICGRRMKKGAAFLAASLKPRARPRVKHFVFQESPRLEADGTVSICGDCPDATVRNGRLVPVCLADFIDD